MLVEAGVEPQYLGARRTVDPAAFARLARRIRRNRPDVVHAHLEMAMTMALPAAALAGVPAVGTFHHVYRPLTGRGRGPGAAGRRGRHPQQAPRSSSRGPR